MGTIFHLFTVTLLMTYQKINTSNRVEDGRPSTKLKHSVLFLSFRGLIERHTIVANNYPCWLETILTWVVQKQHISVVNAFSKATKLLTETQFVRFTRCGTSHQTQFYRW